MLERSSGELSLAHYRVLSAIGGGDQRATRVAAKLSLGKPTVSANVEALVRRGLVARSAVSGDQRGVALALTDEGRATLELAESAMVERLTGLLANSDEDASMIIEALSALGRAIDAASERTLRDRAG